MTDFGSGSDGRHLRETLTQCRARVEHAFKLIPGVAAGMTPEALKQFLSRYPNARVIPDRRRQIPPTPFGPDEWAKAAGPGDSTGTSPDQPNISPLAVSLLKADAVHEWRRRSLPK